jgi:hypothetical protein
LKARQHLEAIGAVGLSDTSEFWKIASRSNEQIKSFLKAPRFEDFYIQYSVLRLNKSITARIQGYFRNE